MPVTVYNGYRMVMTLLLMFALSLFMVINTIIVCIVAIRLGYGPPNWQTALNLVVRVTTLQDQLNKGRYWLDQKARWADKLLHRLHVPKPIIIVYTLEEDETDDDQHNKQIDESAAVSVKELLEGQQPKPQPPDEGTTDGLTPVAPGLI